MSWHITYRDNNQILIMCLDGVEERKIRRE